MARLVPPAGPLSRRERQIMDIIYARGQATAKEVLANLPDPPSYSAVRGLIRVLENKGQLRHRREGLRYVYFPRAPRTRAGRQALQRALEVFYGGNLQAAVAALLEVGEEPLSEEQVEALRRLIEQTRQKGA